MRSQKHILWAGVVCIVLASYDPLLRGQLSLSESESGANAADVNC